MDINKYVIENHQMMIDKGFYDCPVCKDQREKIKNLPKDTRQINKFYFCGSCNCSTINQNKNIGELLMLVVSELGEALGAHRNNKFADWKMYGDEEKHNNRTRIISFEGCIKDTFEDEIADVFLRLFDLCGYLGITVKEFPLLEMQCFENVGAEFFWLTGMLTNLPGQKVYYDESDNLDKEINEISLVIKRLQCFCENRSIDIEKHINAKMEFNKTRPYKYNKEY